jgi:adenylate cyclase
MPATLHVRVDDKEQVIECDAIVTIGRVDTNNVVVPDPKASRSHAMIRFLGDGKYYLTDLGSANGTFLNGKRVVVPLALDDGSEIGIGDHVLTFHYNPESVDISESDAVAQQTVLTVGGMVQRITTLVMDIRGYTPLSEQLDPAYLAAVMGSWFRAANEIADNNGGVVDQYIGDAVMIRWVADVRGDDPSVAAALTTAHEMNLVTGSISKDFPDLPSPLRIGAGINTGQAALGHVGASSRRDYTALGDAVNLAFRFEEATKTLKQDVVLGPDSYKRLPKDLWENRLQDVAVRGKDQPITVCALSFADLAQWIESQA